MIHNKLNFKIRTNPILDWYSGGSHLLQGLQVIPFGSWLDNPLRVRLFKQLGFSKMSLMSYSLILLAQLLLLRVNVLKTFYYKNSNTYSQILKQTYF
jgi:hypothetical protein